MFSPTRQLLDLADALRPALEMDGGGEVSVELARFAIKRHRVGPILHRAVAEGASEADPAAKSMLEQAAETNVRRTLRNSGAAARVSALLAKHGIRHTEFKGSALSALLYGCENLRHSKDIDILVEPERAGEAIELLAANGYKRSDNSEIDTQRVRLILRFAKEVQLLDPRLNALVELHGRLMTVTPDGWDDTRFLDAPLDLSNPDYVLYLILHGGASRWHRLKWLADLAAISSKVAPDVRDDVITLGRRYECLPLIAASLRTCRILWEDAPVEAWLDAMGMEDGDSHARRHMATFEKAIHNQSPYLLRESLIRRLEIRRAVPMFGKKGPSRLEVLRKRLAYWYLRKS